MSAIDFLSPSPPSTIFPSRSVIFSAECMQPHPLVLTSLFSLYIPSDPLPPLLHFHSRLVKLQPTFYHFQIASFSSSESMAKQPARVLVTRATGEIGYALVPMIAKGVMLGADQPVILHLLDEPFAAEALNGVKMELINVAFPLLKGVVATSDVVKACTGVNIAVIVGGFPGKEGMVKKDVLSEKDAISIRGATVRESKNIKFCCYWLIIKLLEGSRITTLAVKAALRPTYKRLFADVPVQLHERFQGESITRSSVIEEPGDHGEAHLVALGELEFHK